MGQGMGDMYQTNMQEATTRSHSLCKFEAQHTLEELISEWAGLYRNHRVQPCLKGGVKGDNRVNGGLDLNHKRVRCATCKAIKATNTL